VVVEIVEVGLVVYGNNLEQVIYTHGAQANSAFRPTWVGKRVAVSMPIW